MADTTTEKLKTRSERELEALGEGMDAGQTVRKKKKKKKKPHSEARGTGTDNTAANNAAIISQWRAKAAAARAAGNDAMAAKLEAKIKAMTEGT